MSAFRLGLAARVAVVTGASKGIGLAVVSALVAEGAYVVAGARHSSPELDKLAAGGAVRVVPVDLADPDGPATLVAAAGDRIDILVNNVGSAPVRIGGFLTVTDEQWLTTINLNLLAAVRATRAVLPFMLDGGRGSIVNVCSVNAVLADPNVIDYSAAKAALANFSKSLAKEYGEDNIRVNTVSPGPVMTDLWLGADGVAATVADATGGQADDVVLKAAGDAPLGRFTRPAEVADLVLLLASDRTANVTGADITVDGGLVPTW
ncbi:MAG TPA: SDR family oxidoreductase [Pseudonocardiaceae bacterium]|nr:SDR family oxidoreductase [Pseudonocardiaceae bacterium]